MKVSLVVSRAALLVLLVAPAAPARAGEDQSGWRSAFQKGVDALREERPRDAIAHLRRAIETEPSAPAPYAAIRSAYGRLGRTVGQAGATGMMLRVARQMLNGGQLDEAEGVLRRLTDEHFASPGTHLALRDLHRRRGDAAAAADEERIFTGLVKAILASGDGQTPERAFLVQAHDEEYLIAGLVLGCRVKQQRMHTPPEGGLYDTLALACESGERTAYFDISSWGPDPGWRLKVYRYPAP